MVVDDADDYPHILRELRLQGKDRDAVLHLRLNLSLNLAEIVNSTPDAAHLTGERLTSGRITTSILQT